MFSPITRSELSKVVFFVFYEKGRTILRENHLATAVYFILDGEVAIYKKQWDCVRLLIKFKFYYFF